MTSNYGRKTDLSKTLELDDTLILDDDDSDTVGDTVDTGHIRQLEPLKVNYSKSSSNFPQYEDLIADNSFSGPKNKHNDVCDAWITATSLLDEKKIDEAYSTILDCEDDVYLLRLMIKTGPSCYKCMNRGLSNKLFDRVIKLTKSNFLDNMILNFFLEACRSDLTNHIESENRNSMMLVLESMGKNHKNEKLIRVILDFLKNV